MGEAPPITVQHRPVGRFKKGIIRSKSQKGLHLINAKPELILRTVADIKAKKPDYIVGPLYRVQGMVAFSREMPCGRQLWHGNYPLDYLEVQSMSSL